VGAQSERRSGREVQYEWKTIVDFGRCVAKGKWSRGQGKRRTVLHRHTRLKVNRSRGIYITTTPILKLIHGWHAGDYNQGRGKGFRGTGQNEDHEGRAAALKPRKKEREVIARKNAEIGAGNTAALSVQMVGRGVRCQAWKTASKMGAQATSSRFGPRAPRRHDLSHKARGTDPTRKKAKILGYEVEKKMEFARKPLRKKKACRPVSSRRSSRKNLRL